MDSGLVWDQQLNGRKGNKMAASVMQVRSWLAQKTNFFFNKWRMDCASLCGNWERRQWAAPE